MTENNEVERINHGSFSLAKKDNMMVKKSLLIAACLITIALMMLFLNNFIW